LEFRATPPPGRLRNNIILKGIVRIFAKQCDSIGFRFGYIFDTAVYPHSGCFWTRVRKLL